MRKAMLLIGIVAAVVWAAEPVGTITSAEPFEIGGARAPVAGAPNWPLVAGDTVVMGKAPGLIRLADGTRLFVLPRSRIEITGGEGEAPAVELRSGGVAYEFGRASRLSLKALGKRVSAEESKEGWLWFENEEAWWHPAGGTFMEVASVRRGADGEVTFASRRVTPRNLGEVEGWRGYIPGWATRPGGQGSGVIPEETIFDPNRPPVLSPGRPPWVPGPPWPPGQPPVPPGPPPGPPGPPGPPK